MYSYSRSRGLFAGISLNGTSLSIDKKAGANYYGAGVSSHDLVETSKSSSSAIRTLKRNVAAL